MDRLANLINKICDATNYQTLYALEADFNNVGLTMQITEKGTAAICKIKDHKPLATKPVEDHVYVGNLDNAPDAIGCDVIIKIIRFIVNAKGEKSEIKNVARGWKNELSMYGDSIKSEGYQITEDL